MYSAYCLFFSIVMLTVVLFTNQASGEVCQYEINDFSPDSSMVYTVSQIIITGNNKTKEKIIMSELTFDVGDTMGLESLGKAFESTRNNLLKTGLFNYVTITVSEANNTYITLNINVEERWYLWPNFNVTPHDGNINDWLSDPDFEKIDYCFGLKKYNFRGCKEILSFNIRRGFNNITQVGYSNISIDKKCRHQLGFFVSLLNQNNSIVNVKNNKPLYYNTQTDNNAFWQNKYQTNYTFRQSLDLSHSIELVYQKSKTADSVAMVNPDFFGAGKTEFENMYLSYNLKYDVRNSSYYPLQGGFYQLQVSKIGLGFSFDDYNGYEIRLDLRQYQQIFPGWYFAVQTLGLHASSDTPFFLRNSLGSKKDIVQGYDHYYIAGNNFTYFKTSLKIEIIPTRIIHFKRINMPRFNKIHFAAYLNLFYNGGYVEKSSDEAYELSNSLNDKYLQSVGLSMDCVTYYDIVCCGFISYNDEQEINFGVAFKSFF